MDELQKTSRTLLLHDIRCKLGVYFLLIINSFLQPSNDNELPGWLQ